MDVVFVVLPASLVLALIGVVLFVLAVRRGQLDDLETPALRMLAEDDPVDTEDRDGEHQPAREAGAGPAPPNGSG